MFTRNAPAPQRPARIHVRPVVSDFTVREEEPANRRLLAGPKFVRRAPVRAEALEPEPLRPPTKARLMSRR